MRRSSSFANALPSMSPCSYTARMMSRTPLHLSGTISTLSFICHSFVEFGTFVTLSGSEESQRFFNLFAAARASGFLRSNKTMLLPSLTITVIPYFVLRKLASSERVIFAVIETFLSGSSVYGESKSRVRHLAKILKKSYPQVIHKVIGHALSTVANGCGRQPKPPPASATLVSVFPVGHGRHVAVPTGTAVAALVTLRRSGADARTTGHGSVTGSIG